jgi:hypothetical protein
MEDFLVKACEERNGFGGESLGIFIADSGGRSHLKACSVHKISRCVFNGLQSRKRGAAAYVADRAPHPQCIAQTMDPRALRA